jgi:hypothetical protein
MLASRVPTLSRALHRRSLSATSRCSVALNDAFNSHPAVTGVLWLWHSPIATGVSFCALSCFDFPDPSLAAELSIAWALSGATRRVRVPVTIALAAALAKLRPELTSVPVAKMLLAPLEAVDALQEKINFARTRAAIARVDAAVGASSSIDKFGLAYVIASRALSLFVVGSAVTALRHGVDLDTILQQATTACFGDAFSSSSKSGATAIGVGGRLAASSVLVSTFYVPLVLPSVAWTAALLGSRLERSPRVRAVLAEIEAGRREAVAAASATACPPPAAHPDTLTRFVRAVLPPPPPPGKDCC